MQSRSGLHRAAALLAVFVAAVSVGPVATADDFNGSSYDRNVSLDTNLDVYWTIDAELETIQVAVHAKAASGWAGIGTSEMGGMEGADIVFYETGVSAV